MIDDTQNPASDDSLDRAIRDAMRVDVDERRIVGLEHYWHVQSQRERWRRNARRAVMSVAAVVAIVAGGLLVLHRDAQPPEKSQVFPNSAQDDVASVPPGSSPANDTNRNAPVELPGRAPTAIELLVFASRSGIDTRSTSHTLAIDDVIQHVAIDANADPAFVLDASAIKRANAEVLLLRRMPRAPANQQPAILRLLAVCGSQRSVPSLLRLARNESLRPDALSTLERVVGIDALAQVAAKATDPNVRSALMRRLLTADSQAGLPGYLSLVHNDATRSEALSVAKRAQNVPVEQLIKLLNHADESIRVSAAITLGYINGPETTRLLIARITEQPANSREAWFALMECRGEMAREFLVYATRRPELLGYYNNARVRWAQMIQ